MNSRILFIHPANEHKKKRLYFKLYYFIKNEQKLIELTVIKMQK
jgi:hypothetical protein